MPSWTPFGKATRSSGSTLAEKDDALPTSARCEGRSDDHALALNPEKPGRSAFTLINSLSFLDRFLALWVLLAMIIGVLIGNYVKDVNDILQQADFEGVSVPIVVGLIVMMWPTLTKVQYEQLPTLFRTRDLWVQIGVSLFLNWIIGPFVMLAVASATLPDLAEYREGVILVGIARCIAMVMIWNQLAGGDHNYCAILVIINSILQIVLYAPYALLFINVIWHSDNQIQLEYGATAIAVLIYLGIPLAAGIVTRFGMLALFSRSFFEKKFLPYFSPLALIGLLYTIIIIFAEQAKAILRDIGPVFRVFVPMVVYFAIMWTGTFFAVWWWNKRKGSKAFGYRIAVVQAFTAGSNNFELSIAVCVALYGVNSRQALAATIGPLVEVPVLLILTWVALYLHRKLKWRGEEDEEAAIATAAEGESARTAVSGEPGVPKAGYFGGRDVNEGPDFDLEKQQQAAAARV